MGDYRRKALVAACLVCLAILATFLKMCWNAVYPRNGVFESVSWSSAQARDKETFVAELEVEPAEISWQGKTIKFREAWLEERHKLDYCFVWYPCCVRLGGINLCFTLESDDVFSDINRPYFVLDDDEQSFLSWHGFSGVVRQARLQDAVIENIRMSLISTWAETRQKNLRFVRKGLRHNPP